MTQRNHEAAQPEDLESQDGAGTPQVAAKAQEAANWKKGPIAKLVQYA